MKKVVLTSVDMAVRKKNKPGIL